MEFPVRIYRLFVILLGSVMLFSACSAHNIDNVNINIREENGDYQRPGDGRTTDGSIDFPWAQSDGVRNVLRRASQLANITWTPLFDVPGNAGVYPAGMEELGIPYSSTKQIDKYVGQDVSLHTFMTAVHNPRSVLYTENLRNAPYNGLNCACYYGTVCSSAVAYALNLRAPYPSSYFPTLPGFYRIPDQELNALLPGDVLHKPGHVLMIFRTYRSEDGRITDISVFEAASRHARITKMSSDIFRERFMSGQYVVYRYEAIDSVDEYISSPYVAVGNETCTTVLYNDSLCPNRGDESVYRIGETVTINVFNDTYSSLVIKGIDEYELSVAGGDVLVNNLRPGKYSAYLSDGVRMSSTVTFLVAEPIVQVKKQGSLHVSFSCKQGKPSYCVLCDKVGSFKSIHLISDEEMAQGYTDIEPLDNNSYYCKVVFVTPYGTVINEPIDISNI